MRTRVGIALALVVSAGVVARAVQTHHDTVERVVNRLRRRDLAETGAVKLRAAADLGAERLRAALTDVRHRQPEGELVG
ncbi:MAG TPA: hypothetical protein VHA73_15475 [Acidimicrobiales bacterium]|jgi:hypothetical protein|nr:hypothetical protein [Acidimicrobiales bacterium]